MKFAINSLRNKQDLPLVLIFSIMSGRKDTVAITLVVQMQWGQISPRVSGVIS